MSDLAAFLRARLDEDEAAAKWASKGPWMLRSGGFVVGGPDGRDGSPAVTVAAETQQWNGAHIARHNPVRVLREVEAKRAILGRHCRIEPGPAGTAACAWCSDDTDAGARFHQPWPCPDVLSLAAVYSDHPDYDQAWALS